MKNIIFLFSLIVLTSSTIQAQKTSEEVIQEFFQTYKINSSDAIDIAFQHNKWMQEQEKEIFNLKYQLGETIKLLGEYLGYEKIEEISLGESLKKLTFIVKYERQPLRFILNLYKPKNDWGIQDLYFDGVFAENFNKVK